MSALARPAKDPAAAQQQPDGQAPSPAAGAAPAADATRTMDAVLGRALPEAG